MRWTFDERIQATQNPAARRTFELMREKESCLGVSADLTNANDLYNLVEAVADEVCLVKTHIDIVEDFSHELVEALQELQEQKGFVIFEDRKFADIGNTVTMQYSAGVHHIADWSDITNAHVVPGPGVIEGLAQVGQPKGRGLLLLAEMSSAGNLATGEYTEQNIAWAKEYSDFVIGFIAMRRLIDEPQFLTMTPGVKLQAGGDGLRQQYRTPQDAMEAGTDIILVGRGIYEAEDPQQVAAEYRRASWDAYNR